MEQLTRSREETIQLNREISTMKRDSETSWASERVESALLRERINDVAAEVARLTAALEGPNSPIEAMLSAAEPAFPARVAKPANDTAPAPAPVSEGGGTLAERIRALQSHASRARQPG